MKRLAVYLEMQGQFRSVGFITGENFRDGSRIKLPVDVLCIQVSICIQRIT